MISATGGYPKQGNFHSEGSIVEGCPPNGQGLIIRGKRDHFWKRANRFFTMSITGRISEKLLFDAYGKSASFSPDGKQFLSSREGERSWRKSYTGSQASQI